MPPPTSCGPGRMPCGACSPSPSASSGCSATCAGLDVLELACGTAYVSAWLARQGARPVAVDLSGEQLATARRLQRRFGRGQLLPGEVYRHRPGTPARASQAET